MAKLTKRQEIFLKELFGPSMGNLKVAAKACGVSDYSELMTDELTDAIRKRADSEFALNVPRAVHVINQMLNDDGGNTAFYSDKLHKVATDILDRAGLAKQERTSGTGTTVGLVFLPNKRALPEPPVDALTIEGHVNV